MRVKPLGYDALSEGFNRLGRFYFKEAWTGVEILAPSRKSVLFLGLQSCSLPSHSSVSDPFERRYSKEEWAQLCESYMTTQNITQGMMASQRAFLSPSRMVVQSGDPTKPYGEDAALAQQDYPAFLRQYVDNLLRHYATEKALVRLVYSKILPAFILDEKTGHIAALPQNFWMQEPPQYYMLTSVGESGILVGSMYIKYQGAILLPSQEVTEFLQKQEKLAKDAARVPYTTSALTMMQQAIAEHAIFEDNQPTHEAVIAWFVSKGAAHADAMHMARFILLSSAPVVVDDLERRVSIRRKEEIRRAAIALIADYVKQHGKAPKKKALVNLISRQKEWGISSDTIEREFVMDECIGEAKKLLTKESA